MISDELYEQLKLWLVDATGPQPSWDVRCFGLCHYVDDNELVCEMQHFWNEAKLSLSWPFNFNDPAHYDEEKRKGRCHLNLYRLAWVRERIAEYDHTMAMHEEAKRT